MKVYIQLIKICTGKINAKSEQGREEFTKGWAWNLILSVISHFKKESNYHNTLRLAKQDGNDVGKFLHYSSFIFGSKTYFRIKDC